MSGKHLMYAGHFVGRVTESFWEAWLTFFFHSSKCEWMRKIIPSSYPFIHIHTHSFVGIRQKCQPHKNMRSVCTGFQFLSPWEIKFDHFWDQCKSGEKTFCVWGGGGFPPCLAFLTVDIVHHSAKNVSASGPGGSAAKGSVLGKRLGPKAAPISPATMVAAAAAHFSAPKAVVRLEPCCRQLRLIA